MDSGFEALPPRETGRLAKRRRAAEAERPAAPLPAAATAAAGAAENEPQPTGSSEAYVKNLVHTQYEFLDHTADVQIHSWAETLGDAFAYAALAMFAYKTDPDGVDIDPACTRKITATGHDVVSLLYNFMDACLFEFATDDFVAKDMRVAEVVMAPRAASGSVAADTGATAYSITVVAFGERFLLSKHLQGTEIKAITYSNLQIFTNGGLFTAGDEVQGASVKAADPAAAAAAGSAASGPHGDGAAAAGAEPLAAGALPAGTGRRRAACDVYIIVDI